MYYVLFFRELRLSTIFISIQDLKPHKILDKMSPTKGLWFACIDGFVRLLGAVQYHLLSFPPITLKYTRKITIKDKHAKISNQTEEINPGQTNPEYKMGLRDFTEWTLHQKQIPGLRSYSKIMKVSTCTGKIDVFFYKSTTSIYSLLYRQCTCSLNYSAYFDE